MDKYIGKLLDNRYEMLEILGVGGMAVVYKARDRVLNRYVAIKIMKEEFAEDEEFRRRFHNESQAIAKLSHNNIVSVYDVSQRPDVQYIVMELIEGVTLKDYLLQKGRLSWQETIFFAQQISKALSHAHSRGIIHQDIKPHNIILLRDGTVKVTDFGIARFEKNQETRVIQEAIGSVHYISPEQAKGSRINHCADLYSLGIVMYECLTGRVPFDGETPLAIVMQHMNAQAPLPSQVVPGIPQGMDDIVMRAMCPTLAQRYQSAEEIYNDLERLKSNPRQRFSAAGAASRDPSVTATDETIAIPRVPRTPQGSSHGQQRRPAQPGGDPYRGSGGEPARRIRQQEDYDDEDDQPRRRKSKRSMGERLSDSPAAMVGIAVAIFAVIAIGVAVFMLRAGGMFGSSKLDVPNLIGMQLTDAQAQYGADFTIQESGQRVADANAEEGEILSQTPDEKTKAAKGTVIKVTVCSGPEEDDKQDEEFTLPASYVGEDAATVAADLDQHEIRTTQVEEPSLDVETGKVIRTDPVAGSRVKPGDIVTLYVSSGIENVDVKVPNLIGKTESEAEGALTEAHLSLGTVRPVEDDAPEGQVVRQSIQEGTSTKAGTRVDIEISTGPKQEQPDPEPDPSTDPEQGGTTSGATEGIDYVTVALPTGVDECKVSLYDASGQTLIEERICKTADEFTSFQVRGPVGQSATYMVYIDNIPEQQHTVTFEATS